MDVAKLLESDSLSDVGAPVRDRRVRRAMTQGDLGAATGLSKPYICYIETARFSPGMFPSHDALAAIERALELPVGSLTHRVDLLRAPESVRQLLRRLLNPSPVK